MSSSTTATAIACEMATTPGLRQTAAAIHSSNAVSGSPLAPTSTVEAQADGRHEGARNKAPSYSQQQSPGQREFVRKYRHTAAVHSQTRPSTLSHDATVAPSFLGFRNLMVIVLVAGNVRLMIENLQKYGVLICVRCHDFRGQDLLLGLILFVLIPCHLFAAYLIELCAAWHAQGLRVRDRGVTGGSQRKGKGDGATDEWSKVGSDGELSPAGSGTQSPTEAQRRAFSQAWNIVAIAHGVNISLALAITTYVVYFHVHHPLIGTISEMHAIIVWLKTASYAFTNRDLRHAYLHPVKGELASLPPLYSTLPYPRNVTMSNLCYFWLAPTLVYQPVYPRSPGPVRWVFVAKRVGEVFVLGVFIWFCSAQYATPILVNSLDKIATLDFAAVLERLLKLSTVSLVIWLAGFFALFQSYLNALAEVMRFGDRSFYDDWWNSDSLGTYWRTWNKPVYSFFRRHVYSPMMGRGWSSQAASLAVFTLSAVLHELLVGIPTHNLIGVAFLGMFLQLPLIAITRPLEQMRSPAGRLIGNSIFWISFTIFGQPLAALLYFYAWQAKYGSVSRTIRVSSA